MPITRIPPHDLEAESAVLGALLIDKEAITLLSELVKPEYFYNDHHRIIFESMLELYEQRSPIDLLTLTASLKKKKMFEKIGGSSYLASLANAVPTAANAGHYAEILKNLATRRSLIRTGAMMTELAFDLERDGAEILDKVEQDVFALSQNTVRTGFVHIKQTLAESFDKLDDLHRNGLTFRGVETGFSDIDNILSGMQQSNLIVLAARPGQGKTAFVINIAQFVAVHSKQAVGVFSLEMSKEELVDRLLISQADIDAWRLKTGRLSEEDFEKLSRAMGELADAKIYIDDTPGITIGEIRTKARRLQMETGLKLLIVDYLQLASPGSKRFDSRVQEVGYVSQNLKNLARELKIPVIAVSQLSRAVEHRSERKPQLADLRESGAIEQDADVVMFLYSEETEMLPQRVVKVLIAKHRNGATGEKELMFRGDRMRFYNIEHSVPQST